MTPWTLNEKMNEFQREGLNPVIRSMAENAIVYRKWGDLGRWSEYRIDIQNRLRKYQPEWLPVIFKLFNEA